MTSGDVVDLVTAFIWPVVVLILAVLYRRPLTGLLGRLRSFEAPGIKGVFNDPAEKVRQEADVVLSSISTSSTSPADPATQALINLTTSQPWSAVHQAWRLVRQAAKEATAPDATPFADTSQRVKHLADQGKVPENVHRLTTTLRSLYYGMKKQPELVTPSAASDFVDTATSLAQALHQPTPPNPRIPSPRPTEPAPNPR